MFNILIKLFFLLLLKEFSYCLIYFCNFIFFVCGIDDYYFEKKGYIFCFLYGYLRVFDYFLLILDLMYKFDWGVIYFMIFVCV